MGERKREREREKAKEMHALRKRERRRKRCTYRRKIERRGDRGRDTKIMYRPR